MIIPLGNKIRAEVIDSVLGQLSDGIWENSGAMNKYWMFADVDGTNLSIDDEPFSEETDYSSARYYGRTRRLQNGFYGKSKSEICNWFANKAKQVVKIWAEDDGKDPKEIWRRDCTESVDYMGGHDVQDVTVADVYECYDFLKGRSGKKYGRTYEEPIPEEIAPEDDMYEVEDYVEPDVSGGMNPSQQELEDFFTGASTSIRRTFTKYPSDYVKATRQEPYYRGGYTRQYDCYYIVFFNGGGSGKKYARLADAKYALRTMIDSNIKRYGADSVDLEDCFIVEGLPNGEVGRRAYSAVNDPYFDAPKESDLDV